MRKFLILTLAVLLSTLVWTACGQNPSVTSTEGASITPQGDEILAQHSDDQPVASPAVAIAPRQPVVSEGVTYGEQTDTPLQGYLARPESADNDLPGLIVIHEWWGLNDNIEKMTERLAGEGYTALAVDLYGGEVADAPDAARSLVQAVSTDVAKAEDNLLQAFRYLETEQGAAKIGSIGWCFGGGWSLNTALLLPEALDAAVIYYGRLQTDPDRLEPLQMPILGIFGALDQNPSVESVREFEAVLQDLGKSIEVHVYENADHAFANPSGRNYNEAAAEAAWTETVDFLAQALQ